jgi:probable phosphoglycerate mutase
VAAVYASQAIRAQQTAEPVAEAFSMDLRVLDGVHEVSAGHLEDRNDSEAVRTYLDTVRPWTRGDLGPAIPGGESGYQVRERFLSAVDQLRSKHAELDAGGVVVLVSHGGAIRLGAEWLSRNVRPEVASAGLIPNTGIVRLEARDDGDWHCLEWAGITLGR